MPLGSARFGLISAVGGSVELIETVNVYSSTLQV